MIGGGGFSMMAWELAKHRYPLRFTLSPDVPGCREFAAGTPGAATWKFYRILDEAELQFATLRGSYGLLGTRIRL